MSKQRKRPNKAKTLVAQPLFRSRQEQPKKVKAATDAKPPSPQTGRLRSFWQLEKPSKSKRVKVTCR